MNSTAKSSSMNTAPAALNLEKDLPAGFMAFYEKLHATFYPWQQELLTLRKQLLFHAHKGELPEHHQDKVINAIDWRIQLPNWISDQRNQMTGPADDAALVVKMLNSGAPGVMIDLEDSMANHWENLMQGYENSIQAVYGTLSYFDEKKQQNIAIHSSETITLIRVRGLHLHQDGLFAEELSSASLFDVAMLVYQLDFAKLKHPLCFYIPKSESAEEAKWWSALFKEMAAFKGIAPDQIRCMALVESHPLAYQIEAFIYHLQDHIIGLNLGRWDYMASLIHYNLNNPAWVLPDRNTIPGDIAFFQNLRGLIPEICHRRGIFAIGGMTALFPDRSNAELNERALANLERDKKNEANFGFDGAWTGHPDQNAIAIAQFPQPNQLKRINPDYVRFPDLRPEPKNIGMHTVAGSLEAAKVTIRYRYGVLKGKGASLIEGYMEDLATDRIYRLMLTQRCLHYNKQAIKDESGLPEVHDFTFLTNLFDEALKLVTASISDKAELELYEKARRQTEEMIVQGRHDPV